MRAPVLVFPRTRTPSQGRGYLDAGAAGSPEAFGLNIAKGAGSIGAGLTDMATVWQDRLDKTERFNALDGLSDLKINTAVQLEELKRSVDPGVTDFVQQAQEVVRKAEQGYLAKVPSHLQPEMTYKLGEMKRTLLIDSMNFQYTQSDANFNAGLAKQYTRAQVAVSQDPSKYDAEIRSLFDSITASDLPAPDKLKLGQDMQAGLSAVKYGKEYENIKRNPVVGVKNRHEAATYQRAADVQQKLVNRGFTPVQAAAVAGRWIQESGVQSAGPAGDAGISHGLAQWNKERLEMLKSDSWRRPRDVGKDWKDADLQLEFFLWELANTEQAAGQRLRNATTPEEAAEAMMDYERPQGWSAGNSRGGHGWENTIAATLRLSGAEATMALDLDPTYRNLPLEARIAIQRDGDAKVQQDITAQQKARQAGEEAGRNTLFRNLMDGTAGETDIMTADKAGYLDDAAHYAQAQKLLADRNEGIAGSTRIQGLLAGSGAPDFNPDDTDDKKAFNAYIGKDGLTQLSNMNKEFVDTVLAPAVTQLHDLPTDTAGLLTGMSRSNDPKKALFALEVLAQLEGVDQRAYRARMDEDVEKDVDFWRARKDVMTPQELLMALRAGADPATRKITEALREEAEKVLLNDKMELLNLNVASVIEGFDDSAFSSPSVGAAPSNVPFAMQGLKRDYMTAFVDLYPKYNGNAEETDVAAKQVVARQWGMTRLGGQGQVVMKYPPEKAGYEAVDGSYDWLDAQIRLTTPVGPELKYQLLSDDQTKQEFDLRKKGGSLPSYMIAVNDPANGGWRVLSSDVNGLPRRWNFTQAMAPVGEFLGERERLVAPTPAQVAVEQQVMQGEAEAPAPGVPPAIGGF